MADKFSKVIFLGILICLIIIASKPNPYFNYSSAPSNVNVENGEQIIQLAPNRIAVVDNRISSGMRGTVLVYDFDSTSKTFKFIGKFNYVDYFNNPEKYGVPQN